ncbi:MAG: polyribonucleotide nucleotidyltransferase [SAR86 cluster bacterium BACL1 MAG-120828-bin5]|uniref:Polyribonucleotide nucleotidyltransferase n=1 Tax=SAR86 cluster bacterium BACL1 MAG-120820-bin45 TaxID=1655612 RepID=A0A0R2UCV2_9GAMM|nr:MAG: polyribonucleotide nucleotidyltransferase [SAR86 cluster bacterium BACL1 MAG-120507-bin14]KRO95618.1 MAG: polyribonucleotide nucleotidyltransferase [SAR86 cluster bacterium BACL1 MAG-120820-bin45]KRO96807.1 MAG: polyribonucleotide nucleotidyltransferase [SAR86 cluster bacterium BACL1 MAG-120828-bin5]KRO98459.1 MAG: polyribonucleotide nucleotidyltransferase [SAR86 cluster bacterium BACL1 MAG-120813-bin36]KRO99055.1 MAG: polyribonucleotide nucleotidyltransferase [SAR86 cluster bacterium B
MEDNKLNTQSVEFEYGNKTVKIETGKIARQATSSIIVTIDNLVVLTTMVARKEADPRKDFFPLAVFYQEKFYAAGKIPGGYFKREARPTEEETLTSRLIDRPIRPLFPEDFKNEVQIFCTVLSADKNINPDIASLIGASAALSISGVPFQGPLGAARVGFIDSNFVLNPSPAELENSMLDMVVAGTADAVLMVESEASELSEDIMLGSVLFGHQEMQKVIKACSDLRAKVNPTPWEFSEDTVTTDFTTKIAESFTGDIAAAFKIADKAERGDAIHAIKDQIIEKYAADLDDLEKGKLMNAFKAVEKDVVRKSILSNEPRIDGRDRDTVRPIFVETGVLPSAHGSSLFTRGETQALVVATLGSTRDAQRIESLNGEQHNQFMLHYNFPAYSVGEIGMPLGPKRREIGHGNLAKRAIKAVLPNPEEFGYTLRVVSEITESNGSSSMASVCGTSLSLMDAGVPITNPVAGIAMGLIKEADNFAVLTDILGDEDHLGDMDFKVAGTKDGVTALQMDIKVQGITADIMESALEKAKTARLHILEKMNAVISGPKELSDNTPAMKKITVHQDKIKEIIGKGGAVIKAMQADTGASIDVNDDGVVTIFGETQSIMLAALEIIEGIIEDPELNKIYEGKVVKIVDFGAFVNILPGKDGLLHVSEISAERVENVSDVLTEGDIIKVKLIGFDRGKMKLSKKAIEE